MVSIASIRDRARSWRGPMLAGRRLRQEDGYSFPELSVVAVSMLIVFGAAVTFYFVAVNRTGDTQARSNTQSELQVAIERIVRDVREASSAVPDGGRTLTIQGVSSTSGATGVRYECEAGVCTRQEIDAHGMGMGAPVELIRGLDPEAQVFTSGSDYDPGNPGYVTIELTALPEGRNRAITLRRGVALRCVNSGLDEDCLS